MADIAADLSQLRQVNQGATNAVPIEESLATIRADAPGPVRRYAGRVGAGLASGIDFAADVGAVVGNPVGTARALAGQGPSPTEGLPSAAAGVRFLADIAEPNEETPLLERGAELFGALLQPVPGEKTLSVGNFVRKAVLSGISTLSGEGFEKAGLPRWAGELMGLVSATGVVNLKDTFRKMSIATVADQMDKAGAEAVKKAEPQWAGLRDRLTEISDTIVGRTEKRTPQLEKRVRQEMQAYQQRTLEELVGTTPEETAALRARRAGDDLEAAYQANGLVGPFRVAQRDKQAALSARFELLEAPHLDKPASDEALQALSDQAASHVTDSTYFAKAAPGLQRITQTVQTLAGRTSRAVDEIIAQVPGSGSWTAEQRAAYATQPAVQQALADIEPVTLGNLKSVRGELGKYVTHADGPTRHLAMELQLSLMDAAKASGLPIDPILNTEYSYFRKTWDSPTLKQLHNATQPADVASLFTDTHLGSLFRDADPVIAEWMRGGIGDFVNSTGVTPKDFLERFGPETLSQIYGRHADGRALVFQTNAMKDDIEKLFTQRPQLRTQFLTAVQLETRRLQAEQLPRAKRAVLSFLERHSPAEAKTLRHLPPEHVIDYHNSVISQPGYLEGHATAAGQKKLAELAGVKVVDERAKWVGKVLLGEAALGAVGPFITVAAGAAGVDTASRALTRSIARSMLQSQDLEQLVRQARAGNTTQLLSHLARNAARGLVYDVSQAASGVQPDAPADAAQSQ